MKINKKVEKIRDDLYVKKGIAGTYSVVYPMKDAEGKKIKGNMKRVLFSDLISSIPMLLTVGVILMMLLPGAYQIKNQCEATIKDVQDNACYYCSASTGYGVDNIIPQLNISVDSVGEK